MLRLTWKGELEGSETGGAKARRADMTEEERKAQGEIYSGEERAPEGVAEFFACLGEWEKLGRACQEALGMLPRLVDSSGRVVAGEERLGGVCAVVHASPLGRRRCRECYWRHSLGAEKASGHTFTCHGGLVYVWLPLGKGLAAVVGGFRAEGEEWIAPSSLVLELGLSAREVSAASGATPERRREDLEATGKILSQAASSAGRALGGQIAVLAQLERLGGLAVKRASLLEADPTTGILSGEGFRAKVKLEAGNAEKTGGALSVALFELEGGAQGEGRENSGEGRIEEVAQVLAKSIRKGAGRPGGADIVGRAGGRSLGIVLPKTDHHQAYQLARRLHEGVREWLDGKGLTGIEAHFGVASFSPGVSGEELLKRAEMALAAAKRDETSPGHIFAAEAKSTAHEERRVVVTGIGMVTPYGMGKDAFWKGALEGRSVIDRITFFDPSEMPSRIGGEVKDFDPLVYMDAKGVKRSGRSSHLAVAAACLAVEDGGLKVEEEDRDRMGVVMGSAVGGLEFGEEQVAAYMQHGARKVSPYLSIVVFGGAVSSEVSLHFGVKGPTITVSTGCAAGSDAIGYAFRMIKEGKGDVMIAGGTEAPLRPVIFASFCAINALSTRNDAPEKASRPFDLKRDGFVMSEGATVLIVEELQHALKRGAEIYGEIVGYAATGDAFHMTRPAPNGEEAARAMQLALEEAQLKPEEVQYINAHGSSTPLNDKTETTAIKSVFGEHAYRVAINSTKSLLGHPIGASGAIELAACLLSIRSGMLHPTINYEFFDPECDLDYVPNVARPARVKVAMSNSFGFGGKNAVLAVKAFEG